MPRRLAAVLALAGLSLAGTPLVALAASLTDCQEEGVGCCEPDCSHCECCGEAAPVLPGDPPFAAPWTATAPCVAPAEPPLPSADPLGVLHVPRHRSPR